MTRKKNQKQVNAIIRCAIYTRKSSEEGLDQDFNSLDAQRESAEAFIASQKNEGWTCLPDRYDDGGFSGGDMDRPALAQLLADIQAGRVDCVVVYKVDRLSRSLMDFAKIVEIFERHEVSFVSVTQAFNTTHSMGRLTLNILLSFAQFEREIIGERIRDKISAQRRKGRWAGSSAPLGYDIDRSSGRCRLVVNPEEAARIRKIFQLYLSLGALLPVVADLERRSWNNKFTEMKSGATRGGSPFNKNSLHKLLTSPIYIGKLRYDGELYDGEHEAIITPEEFQEVAAQLNRNAQTGGTEVRNKYGALLKSLLFCKPCGKAMIHSFTIRVTKRYRYYRCGNSIRKGHRACPVGHISAPEIEQVVVDQIRQMATDVNLRQEVLRQADVHLNRELEEVRTERRHLERENTKHHAEVQRLATTGRTGGKTTERIAALHDKIKKGDERLALLRDHESKTEQRRLKEPDVLAAFADFDTLWLNLAIREQVKIVRLLVARVEFDVKAGEVSVTFHPSGISALAKQQSEDAA